VAAPALTLLKLDLHALIHHLPALREDLGFATYNPGCRQLNLKARELPSKDLPWRAAGGCQIFHQKSEKITVEKAAGTKM
jgi:hypothetical protein